MGPRLARGVAVVIALVAVIALFGLPIGSSLTSLWEGSFGTPLGWARTLVRMSPLLLCGLGIGLAWKAGVFNIGGEGQFIMGGVFGGIALVIFRGVPPGLQTVLILAASCLGGSLFAGIASWMHQKRGVSVVISTILLNFVATQLLLFAVQGPLKQTRDSLPQSESVPEAVRLARLNPQSDLHLGILIAIGALFGAIVWMRYSIAAKELTLVGSAPRVARANRILTGRVQRRAMAWSGALCGLAAGTEYLGINGVLDQGFSQQYGFVAIPVALMGMLSPVGIGVSALGFGALYAGSQQMARFERGGDTVIYVVQAVLVIGLLIANRNRTVEAPT